MYHPKPTKKARRKKAGRKKMAKKMAGMKGKHAEMMEGADYAMSKPASKGNPFKLSPKRRG